jgi:hypothetical protein
MDIFKKTFHPSGWIKCMLCGEEFWGKRAKICRECHLRMQNKKSEAEFEAWVNNGGEPKEM